MRGNKSSFEIQMKNYPESIDSGKTQIVLNWEVKARSIYEKGKGTATEIEERNCYRYG